MNEYSGYMHTLTTGSKSSKQICEYMKKVREYYNIKFKHKLPEIKTDKETDKGNEFNHIDQSFVLTKIKKKSSYWWEPNE